MAIWSYLRGAEVLDIKVGYHCNNACVHCVVDPVRHRIAEDHDREDLSTEEVEGLIDTAVLAQAKAIVLTGGEVTIRKDFVRLLEYAVSRDLKVVIQTNGRALANRPLCDRLADLPDLLFVVALHASNAVIHDQITQRSRSFKQTCSAIRNLRAIDQEVAAKIVLSTLNQHELLTTAILARSLDVNEFCVVFPHALDFPKEQFLQVVPRYKDLRAELRKVCLYSESENFPMTFETIPYCIVSDQEAFWKRNCDLHSACQSRQNSSQSCINVDGRFDWETLRPTMKQKADFCAQCVFDPLCEGPWCEYVDAYGFDEFSSIPPRSVANFLASVSLAPGLASVGKNAEVT